MHVTIRTCGLTALALTAPALVALAGCGATHADSSSHAQVSGKPVDAAALQDMYRTAHREDGVVLQGAHEGAHWTRWLKPDGTMTLSAAHGLFTDTGRFTVEGDQLCSTWTHIDSGKKSCVHVVKTGPDAYVTYGDDGAGSSFRMSRQSAAEDHTSGTGP